MREKWVQAFTAAIPVLGLAVGLVAVTTVTGPVAAQADRPPNVGICCADQDDGLLIPRADCISRAEEATWTPIEPTSEARKHIDCGACAHGDNLTCRYTTEDRCSGSGELFCPDKNCQDCLEQAIPDDDDGSTTQCMMHRLFRHNAEIIDNMATFHALQERIVEESEKGREMKALFHEHMLELGIVLLRNPDLKERGLDLLTVATPAFRDLLDEPGGEPLVLTPEWVEKINSYLADVADHASPEAQAALDQVRAEFETVEGMSLREIRTKYRPE